MKVRLFLIAALLMGTVAHMAAQDKKEFTLEVYGGEIPNVKPAFDEEHFLGGEITKNGILSSVTIPTPEVEVGLSSSEQNLENRLSSRVGACEQICKEEL